MTAREALARIENVADDMEDWIATIESELPSEATLRFLEAAMEWGANSLKWDKRTWPDPVETKRLSDEAQEICERMDTLYRALMAEREASR